MHFCNSRRVYCTKFITRCVRYQVYTPVSVSGGTFSLSGDENFYRNPYGDRKLYCFQLRKASGDGFGVQFFLSISNGDEIIGVISKWG